MDNRVIFRKIKLAVCGISIFGLSSCINYAPDLQDIVPEAIKADKIHSYSVRLSVSGDEGDLLTGTLLESNKLSTAIQRSIMRSGTFSKVMDSPGAEYELTVLSDANVPGMGGDLTATVSGIWKLTRASTHQVVMEEFITASHTATFADAFWGPSRLRIAIAGAVKGFISEGIRRLGQLNFYPAQVAE